MSGHVLVGLVVFTLALVTGGAGVVSAQTPDGLPPANEGVCDALHASGVTPSLYGLCVAYCEALDVDMGSPFGPLPKPPSAKILARYNALKSATDPDMPCVQAASCPCWTQETLDTIGASYPAVAVRFCMGGADNGLFYILSEVNNNMGQQVRVVYENAGAPWCSYLHWSTQPPLNIYTPQELQLPQAQACQAQLLKRTEDLQVNGVPTVCQ